MSLLSAVAGGGSGGSSAPPATASVNATADQTTLGSITMGLTIPGGETPSAYSWEVNGSTAGISDPTAATPTFTWTLPGFYTKTCTATIGGNAVVATPDTFLVGDGAGLVYPLTLSVDSIAYT